MQENLIKEVIVVPNESHVFHVCTVDGSEERGINYVVTLKEFPGCTCEDFLKSESKHSTYVPCKHVYYVFFQVLGLDSQAHEFVHQAALTKVELFQALGGARVSS